MSQECRTRDDAELGGFSKDEVFLFTKRVFGLFLMIIHDDESYDDHGKDKSARVQTDSSSEACEI
jgi:hypothetical protein